MPLDQLPGQPCDALSDHANGHWGRSRVVEWAPVILAVALLLITPLDAQERGEPYRIGYLSVGNAGPYSEASRQGLRDLGWVEGENVRVEWRWAGGKSERLPELVTELVGLKPRLIVTFTTPATQAAVAGSTTIPIVFNAAADPIGSGFVASLARPGGNVTGLTFVPELALFGKQLELLSEIVPGASGVAIVWAATNPVHAAIVEATEATANRLGLQILNRPVRDFDEVGHVFTGLAAGGPSACLVIADLMFFVNRQRLVDVAAKARVPTMYGTRGYVEAGGLVAYGPELLDLQRRPPPMWTRFSEASNPPTFRWSDRASSS